MSKLRKIQKNAEKYEIAQIYNNMTPEQYRQGIQIAIAETRKELLNEFNQKYTKLLEHYQEDVNFGIITTVNILSIELLYELAVQMEAFTETDEERLEAIKYRVQEMYENIMNSIKKYANCKNDKQAHKKFEEKRKKVEKLFHIIID